jgi:hypothetical protein
LPHRGESAAGWSRRKPYATDADAGKVCDMLWIVVVRIAAVASAAAFAGGCSLLFSAPEQGAELDAAVGLDAPVPTDLVDDRLVVRYYLDDDDGSETLQDAATTPLLLPITLESSGPTLVEEPTGRGLEWTAAGGDGRACVDVVDTKVLAAVEGATAATLEAVVDIVAGDPNGSRILHIGEDTNSRLSLEYVGGLPHRVVMKVNRNRTFAAAVDGPVGRVVLTAVFDSGQAIPLDRLWLYLDGERLLTQTAFNSPAQGETVDLSLPDTFFCIGNREVGNRSPEGRIYYGAIYARALSEADIINNVALLLANDDTPAE